MRTTKLIAGFAVCFAVIAGSAHAGGKVYDLGNKTYGEECGGSCHVAYPPLRCRRPPGAN
jgi:hypothetical protein